MRLTIEHHTEYRYDQPVDYALQRLRLWPRNWPCQEVDSWEIKLTGGIREARFVDGFGNETWLVSARGGLDHLGITARGAVVTSDTSGMSGPAAGFAPLWLFQQETDLTRGGPSIQALAREVGGSSIDHLHSLMALVRDRVAYEVGATHSATGAEESLSGGSGVCQDHAHVFCAVARLLGLPARYVSGYLFMHDTVDQAASHAWAEAHLEGLGWVGFDCSNGICPDELYVRVAVGRDYADAAPVSGIRFGPSQETLAVRLNVSQ